MSLLVSILEVELKGSKRKKKKKKRIGHKGFAHLGIKKKTTEEDKEYRRTKR